MFQFYVSIFEFAALQSTSPKLGFAFDFTGSKILEQLGSLLPKRSSVYLMGLKKTLNACLEVPCCHNSVFIQLLTMTTAMTDQMLGERGLISKCRHFCVRDARSTEIALQVAKELVAVESTSSGSANGSLHEQSEAKESSAVYRKLQSTAHEAKPELKLIKSDTEETSSSITGLRFCDIKELSCVFSLLLGDECGDFSLFLMFFMWINHVCRVSSVDVNIHFRH